MAKYTGIYVSRAGEKLSAAIEAFGIDPTGFSCVDFGANVGGFTDCLLRRGAKSVVTIDTGYGDLAWTLRKDPRVTVMERTNALHLEPTTMADLGVIDVAWTPQNRIVPAAMAWLKPDGFLVSLLKPHYELTKLDGKKPHKTLTDEQAEDVVRRVNQQLTESGFPVSRSIRSPIRGKGGNLEFLLRIEKPDAP